MECGLDRLFLHFYVFHLMNCGLNLRKEGSSQATGDSTVNEITADTKKKPPIWKHSIDANRKTDNYAWCQQSVSN